MTDVDQFDLESLPKLAKLPKHQRHQIYTQYAQLGQFFAIEYTPSKGKTANCRVCKKGLSKSSLRIRHLVCSNSCFNTSKGLLDTCGRYHLPCFLNAQEELERFVECNGGFKRVKNGGQLAGFSKILESDQNKVLKMLDEVAVEKNTDKEEIKDGRSKTNGKKGREDEKESIKKRVKLEVHNH